MLIAIHDDARTTRLTEEPFKNESELQACLERSPYLLVTETEPTVASVQREVRLPSAGILDLLVVDEEGVPVAVEVKLSRNAQSRREVVAQAFDYVADLSTLSFDELDDLVDGALARALNKLGGEGGMSLRKRCATNLRAGRIRLVIAVDTASDDLIRIVRHITDHRDIDVRLLCISQFDKGRILVPRILVSRPTDASSSDGRGTVPKDVDPAFAAVVAAYDAIAEDEWKSRGHGPRYRKIRPHEWPDAVHYEYLNYPGEVGVELHLESDEVSKLAAPLTAISGQELGPGLVVQWDPRWSHSRGRLVAKVGKDQDPGVAVQGMKELMARTRKIIDSELAK
jgi:hypothetical protein